ncbi:hypothetical protein [Methanobrevibacter sp.]
MVKSNYNHGADVEVVSLIDISAPYYNNATDLTSKVSPRIAYPFLVNEWKPLQESPLTPCFQEYLGK